MSGAPLWGHFAAPLVVQAVLPKRTRRQLFELLSPLAWHDTDGRTVTVPAGFRFDGASIPRPLWTLSGGPFDGEYVRATCVHDFQVLHRHESSRAVHERLFRMMRADGSSWLTARVWYYAVQWFGPRWAALSPTP